MPPLFWTCWIKFCSMSFRAPDCMLDPILLAPPPGMLPELGRRLRPGRAHLSQSRLVQERSTPLGPSDGQSAWGEARRHGWGPGQEDEGHASGPRTDFLDLTGRRLTLRSASLGRARLDRPAAGKLAGLASL
eukprot:751277-Hanusia_phi.AAC.2